MNHLPPRALRKPITKVRTKLRRTTAIRCRAHIAWVLREYGCLLTGKVCKSTGQTHVCEGRLDPHHSPTRGAGGGDSDVLPLCRAAHTLIDTPNWSERRVQEEYGVDFRETATQLWKLSPAARAYERQGAPK